MAFAPAVDTRIEPDGAADACMDGESSEDEDLLSGTGSSTGPPPAPPAPPTVLDPKDFEECQDGEEPVVTPPGLPEPVKESIDTNALDAKHALKEAMSTPVDTPDKVAWKNLAHFVIFPRSCLASTRCIVFPRESGIVIPGREDCQGQAQVFSAPVPKLFMEPVSLTSFQSTFFRRMFTNNPSF